LRIGIARIERATISRVPLRHLATGADHVDGVARAGEAAAKTPLVSGANLI
jgi:hypothetical protein